MRASVALYLRRTPSSSAPRAYRIVLAMPAKNFRHFSAGSAAASRDADDISTYFVARYLFENDSSIIYFRRY